jgi:hypothetical protein
VVYYPIYTELCVAYATDDCHDRPASEKTNISVRVVGFCKFTEEQFPPKEAFHSSLSGADISVEDYPHAQHQNILSYDGIVWALK